MTRERREEVVLVALGISLALHVALMFLVKTQVMTRPAVVSAASRHPVTRVTHDQLRPDPVKISEIMDVGAVRDEPAVVSETAPVLASTAVEPTVSERPNVGLPPEIRVPEVSAAVFDAKPDGLDVNPAVPLQMVRIETPSVGRVEAPEFSVTIPNAPAAGSSVPVAKGPVAAEVIAEPLGTKPAKTTFVPSEEVYARVDEKVVEEEKRAVKALVDVGNAAELEKFVNVAMTSHTVGGWKYFKVMIVPRTSLTVVPKDVVVLIDGSGSIGNDRLGSCRKAARRILRTCTNTGDRFNLVVFRNAFSYAFRTWRECDAAGYAAADKWLSNQSAHGRTDVFSTISSVLTLPRNPGRPLIALVVTDGDANEGVSDTADILSKFSALNDGLVSVYMYGVKSSANRELINVLTRGNRGESFVFEGWWGGDAGNGLEGLSERFRDPVLSDLRLVFASGSVAESYPRLLRNLYRGGTIAFVGRVPPTTPAVSFSLRGLNGEKAFEGFFTLPFSVAPDDPKLPAQWSEERSIDLKINTKGK